MATFNELLNEKVYPRLTDGKHKMILTGIGTPVTTKKSTGEETQYIPIRLQVVATGRPVVTNIFADSFKGFFISPIQAQLDPNNEKEWGITALEFINDLIENQTPLDVWVERVTYIGAQGERTTTNYTFFEPKKQIAPSQTASQPNEASEEDIPF